MFNYSNLLRTQCSQEGLGCTGRRIQQTAQADPLKFCKLAEFRLLGNYSQIPRALLRVIGFVNKPTDKFPTVAAGPHFV
ncbi:MAG: hypothetical protein PHQ40_16420 [Anaerolineaceae bacterium]|nr:hypothetical protein [Anaerolineaceae bacterium]